MENKITDKGWEKMRVMLDREMPEKARRIFAWWWFLILLIPVTGFGGWKWASARTELLQNSGTRPVQAFADSPLFKLNSSENTPSNTPLTRLSTTPLAEPNAPMQSAQHSNKRNFKGNFTYAPTSLENKQVMVEELPAERLSYSNPIPSSIISIEYLALKQPTLVSLQAANLTLPKQPSGLQVKQPFKQAAYQSWGIGATTMIATEQFNAINSFSTGLSIDWKMNRHWGIRSGVLYNNYTPQRKDRPIASVFSDDYTAKVAGNVILLNIRTGAEITHSGISPAYADSISGKVYIPVNRLERLEIPLNIFWQPTQRIKVLSGLSLVRTLSTKADRQNYSGDYILRLTDQTAQDDASKLSSNELDKWSADASIGIGVQPGKRFELAFSAKLPLQKLRNSIWREYNNAFNGLAGDQINSSLKGQRRPVFSLSGTIFF